MKKLNKILLLMMSALLVFALAGCGHEYKEQVNTINDAVKRMEDLRNAHVIMTADVHHEEATPEADGVGEMVNYYTEDYRFRIDAKQFNYIVEKTDLLTGEQMERPFKVVKGEKFYVDNNEKDMEYKEDVGTFPAFLGFYLQAGLDKDYVSIVEPLDQSENADYANLTGYRVHKSDEYILRVNSDREKNGGTLMMVESYVDYWIDAAGIVVKMDYVSRDAAADDETDVLYQSYFFDMLGYNDSEIADF